MKILYVTNSISGAGGLERVLAIKASYLADKLGYDVHIIAMNHKQEQVFYEFSSNIHLHNIVVAGNPMAYINAYAKGIKAVVKSLKPDVISVCDDGFKGFFLPNLLGKPCPMIYERHVSKIIAVGPNPGFIRKIQTGIKFRLMNFLAKKYDKFVVLTPDNVREWQLDNIEVIPNPLSFFPEESSALNQKKVIAVGRQSYQKGYDLLLQSWELISSKYPEWNLEIYGKHDPEQNLQQQAEQRKITNTVRFYEPVKDIEQKYLDASIFVMSSRFEGFGMVLTEAMACGVPCVSFDCPCGPADIISNNEDGLLAANGDISDLAAKLSMLIENDAMRIEMGKKAKENVTRFLPQVIVKQWDELFKSLVR